MFVGERFEMIIIVKNVHLNSVMKSLKPMVMKNTRIPRFIFNFLEKEMI